MMFNCSYFDKSILNVYSPMSPKMFLGPVVGQQWPNGAHPNGVHPNGAHPNSAHPMVPTLSVPNLTMPTLTVSPLSSWWPLVTPGKLKCLKVTKSLFKNEEKKLRQTGKRLGQMAKSESWGLPLMYGGLIIKKVCLSWDLSSQPFTPGWQTYQFSFWISYISVIPLNYWQRTENSMI